METTKKLRYIATKTYQEGGSEFKITMQATLDDDCKNITCHFSLTADIMERKGKGRRWSDYSGGCLHDEIKRHFPEFKPFIKLHLCNYLGQPSYPEANGQYFLNEQGIEKGAEYLRIDIEKAKQLYPYRDKDEREYFKYLLFKLGIVEQWKSEADEFIEFLEQKTGTKWVNPYKPEEERFTLTAGDWMNEVKEREENGFYAPEKVAERKERKISAILGKAIEAAVEEYGEKVERAEVELHTKQYILAKFKTDNFFYYHDSKKIVFGGRYNKMPLTQEEAQEIVDKIDIGKLPQGIKFFYDTNKGFRSEIELTKK